MSRHASVYMSSAARFLITFSYAGCRYCGAQRQSARSHEQDDDSVQAAIEQAIGQPVYVASRTDAAVSALDNCLFLRTSGDSDPVRMRDAANDYLFSRGHAIVVKDVRPVDQWFRVQPAIEWREYAYRFVVTDPHEDGRMPPFLYSNVSRIRLRRPLHRQLFASALKAMEGEHSFRSFECFNRAMLTGRERERDPLKNILKADFSVVNPHSGSVLDQDCDLIEVRIRSKSFLYKQVRRMVGAALMLADGSISSTRLLFMLHYGHRWNWLPDYYTAPPEGLALAHTQFRDNTTTGAAETSGLVSDDES